MNFTLDTVGHTDFHPVTDRVEEAVRKSGVQTGIAIVMVDGTTAGVTIMDDEPGLKRDIQEFFERLLPERAHYHHNGSYAGDMNGYAHVRSVLMGTQVAIPIEDGAVRLGAWQRVFVVDFDEKPRTRAVTITVVGA